MRHHTPPLPGSPLADRKQEMRRARAVNTAAAVSQSPVCVRLVDPGTEWRSLAPSSIAFKKKKKFCVSFSCSSYSQLPRSRSLSFHRLSKVQWDSVGPLSVRNAVGPVINATQRGQELHWPQVLFKMCYWPRNAKGIPDMWTIHIAKM